MYYGTSSCSCLPAVTTITVDWRPLLGCWCPLQNSTNARLRHPGEGALPLLGVTAADTIQNTKNRTAHVSAPSRTCSNSSLDGYCSEPITTESGRIDRTRSYRAGSASTSKPIGSLSSPSRCNISTGSAWIEYSRTDPVVIDPVPIDSIQSG